eukprot:6827845-Alexandrium_andersonii.AAC.1
MGGRGGRGRRRVALRLLCAVHDRPCANRGAPGGGRGSQPPQDAELGDQDRDSEPAQRQGASGPQLQPFPITNAAHSTPSQPHRLGTTSTRHCP